MVMKRKINAITTTKVMKRIIAMLTIATASTVTMWADTWSLDSCINYAVEHNLTVKTRQNDIESSKLSVTSAKSQLLPNVSASAGQSWSIGRGLTAENTYANRNTSNTQWGASFTLPVFNGLSTVRQIQLAKANLSTVIEQYAATKDDITLNVITAYLQVLYNRELHEVALNQVELSTYELTRQRALLEAGKIPEVDLLEAESQLAQDKLQATTTANDTRLALVDLAQLLELDDIDNFDITTLDGEEQPILPAESVYNNALNINHTLKAARGEIAAAERNISVAQSGYIPRLSFNAGIGSSYYTVTGMEHPSFSRQMKDNFNTYFGFSLSIPIFDGLSTRNSVKRARVQHVASKLQYQDAENRLYKTIQQAYYQAVSAQERSKSCLIAEDAANKAFEAMREKYNLGRATPSEYEQAKNKALRTTAERIQAHYELILRTRILNFYDTGRY